MILLSSMDGIPDEKCFIKATTDMVFHIHIGENICKQLIELFKLCNINRTSTDSYRPQQNGKAEAFWKCIELHCQSEDNIPDVIAFYNDVKTHASFPSSIINGIHVSQKKVLAFFELSLSNSFFLSFLT